MASYVSCFRLDVKAKHAGTAGNQGNIQTHFRIREYDHMFTLYISLIEDVRRILQLIPVKVFLLG